MTSNDLVPAGYGYLMEPDVAERRMRELHACGYKIRDLASLFHVHPLVVERIVGRQPQHA